MKLPRPTSQAEIRACLEMAGHYRKFIKDYGFHAHPLQYLIVLLNLQRQLKNKTIPDEFWSEQCEMAFVKLKELLKLHQFWVILILKVSFGLMLTLHSKVVLYHLNNKYKTVRACLSRTLLPIESRVETSTFL